MVLVSFPSPSKGLLARVSPECPSPQRSLCPCKVPLIPKCLSKRSPWTCPAHRERGWKEGVCGFGVPGWLQCSCLSCQHHQPLLPAACPCWGAEGAHGAEPARGGGMGSDPGMLEMAPTKPWGGLGGCGCHPLCVFTAAMEQTQSPLGPEPSMLELWSGSFRHSQGFLRTIYECQGFSTGQVGAPVAGGDSTALVAEPLSTDFYSA